jgi:hypothetical protein
MIVALLCPGPSLAKLKCLPLADVTISINRAAFTFESDWWASLDSPLIREGRPKLVGKPHLFTRAEYQPKYPDWHSRSVESLNAFCPFVLDLAAFTVPAALIFAGWLGADAINCYGCDMKGMASFDGTRSDARTEDRWKRERLLFDRAVRFLADKRIKVTRWT